MWVHLANTAVTLLVVAIAVCVFLHNEWRRCERELAQTKAALADAKAQVRSLQGAVQNEASFRRESMSSVQDELKLANMQNELDNLQARMRVAEACAQIQLGNVTLSSPLQDDGVGSDDESDEERGMVPYEEYQSPMPSSAEATPIGKKGASWARPPGTGATSNSTSESDLYNLHAEAEGAGTASAVDSAHT